MIIIDIMILNVPIMLVTAFGILELYQYLNGVGIHHVVLRHIVVIVVVVIMALILVQVVMFIVAGAVLVTPVLPVNMDLLAVQVKTIVMILVDVHVFPIKQ